MKVFVAGGTGVLGRATVQALREAGHQVRTTARGTENTQLARSLGAVPLEVDLYDPAAVRRAIAGSDAVLRLTTKIPSLMKMGKRGAWTETNRLRTVGARVLVDAAILERIPVYVHESVVFVYANGSAEWLDENARTDDGGTTILRAALEGEEEAVRFTQAGGRGIVLRFGGFYGPGAPSTLETAQLLRRRMLPQIGRGTNYISSIWVPDAGRAVAAALSVPAGTYNICDDAPCRSRSTCGSRLSPSGRPGRGGCPRCSGPCSSARSGDSSSVRFASRTGGSRKPPAGGQTSRPSPRGGRGWLPRGTFPRPRWRPADIGDFDDQTSGLSVDMIGRARINGAKTPCAGRQREESFVAMDTVTQGTGLERTSVGVVRRVFEALTTGDVVPVEEFISSDYIDHDTRGGRVAYPEMATLGFARRWNGCIACSEM